MNIEDTRAALKLLLKQKKPAGVEILINAFWTLTSVLAWEKREELLDQIAIAIGDDGPRPGMQRVALLQELAGRDWPLLQEELAERWSRA